jgi:hypothetical protein
MQSNEEVIRVMKDWFAYYAPKNVRQDVQTGTLLAEWCLNHEGGITSFSGLDRAVTSLGDQVLVPEPTKAERDAKAAAKAYRDTIKNKPGRYTVADTQKDNAASAAKAKTEATAKELAAIKAEISREISSYSKGHPSGGLNYTATESGQAKLSKEAGNYQQLTAVEAAKAVLANVRAAKYRLS